MRGGEPSVLQTPPRPNQGGNPPWTPLFNTRLVKTGTPSALCCTSSTVARTGTVLTYSSYIQYRTGTSSSIQCLYRIYCALLYSSLNSRIWYAYQFKKLPGIPPYSVRYNELVPAGTRRSTRSTYQMNKCREIVLFSNDGNVFFSRCIENRKR